MRFLVDTQVFLWQATADTRLPDDIRDVLRSPDHEVWLSAVSAWEIAVKHAVGRLRLPMPPWEFMLASRRRLGLEALPIQEDAVAHLPKLPALHKDPFDRMLVCQAIEHSLTIVTNDAFVRAYPVRTLWD